MAKKSRFFTYLVSLIPGAGQMYLGFMKQGMTTMFIFFFTIFLSDFFRISFILALLPVVWCYGFFDTINKANLSPEEFEALEDRSILEKLFTKGFMTDMGKYVWLGAILITLGVFLLLDNIVLPQFAIYNMVNRYVASEYLRTFVAAGILIALGIRMIAGKKGSKQ